MMSTLRLIQRLSKRTAAHVIGRLCHFNPSENLIICSDPRGGSTWLTEIVSQVPKTVILWEPLHIDRVPQLKKLGFHWRQHIPENEFWIEAETIFNQLLKGKILNEWTCRLTSPYSYLKAERMIIKFCRANALLPWLTRVFSFSFLPIHLIRHPFAIAASQKKYFGQTLDQYVIPTGPYSEVYSVHRDFLTTLHSKEEAAVATWCISNSVPLEYPADNRRWIPLYYEDLLSNPESEIRRIYDLWNLPIPENILDVVSKPSSTAQEATFREGVEAQLSKWRGVFDDIQLSKMQTVLDYFEVDIYSVDSIFPQL